VLLIGYIEKFKDHLFELLMPVFYCSDEDDFKTFSINDDNSLTFSLLLDNKDIVFFKKIENSQMIMSPSSKPLIIYRYSNEISFGFITEVSESLIDITFDHQLSEFSRFEIYDLLGFRGLAIKEKEKIFEKYALNTILLEYEQDFDLSFLFQTLQILFNDKIRVLDIFYDRNLKITDLIEFRDYSFVLIDSYKIQKAEFLKILKNKKIINAVDNQYSLSVYILFLYHFKVEQALIEAEVKDIILENKSNIKKNGINGELKYFLHLKNIENRYLNDILLEEDIEIIDSLVPYAYRATFESPFLQHDLINEDEETYRNFIEVCNTIPKSDKNNTSFQICKLIEDETKKYILKELNRTITSIVKNNHRADYVINHKIDLIYGRSIMKFAIEKKKNISKRNRAFL